MGEGQGEGDSMISAHSPVAAPFSPALLDRRVNLLQHALRLLEHFVIPEAQHPPTVGLQTSRTSGICAGAVAVLPAIDLDDQSQLHAAEVRHERPNGC